MKKMVSFLVVATSIILYSCAKNTTSSGCQFTPSTTVVPTSELQALQDSLTAHNIQAMKDTSGFFYAVDQPGSGNGVTGLCSSIMVYYTGSFFNGKIFDSTATGNPAIFQLGQVIVGWQKGIPHAAKGGDITLYLPPSLAYGANVRLNPQTGDTTIPANSYLVFRVQILDVSN